MKQRTKIEPVEIWVNESSIIVKNMPRYLLSNFKYEGKKLVEGEQGQRTTQKSIIPMYDELPSQEAFTIVMGQGLRHRLIELLDEHSVPYTQHLSLTKLPPPRFDLMRNGRFSQDRLVKEAIEKGYSGLIDAPTRYGKTYMMMNLIRCFPNVNTVVTLPGTDLIKQTHKDFKELLSDRDIKGIYQGSKNAIQGDDITIISMDSLHKANFEDTKLLIVDEPHALVTDGRLSDFQEFINARKYGFGATLSGRFDNADKLLEGLIGPTLSSISYSEAVAEKAICPVKVYMLKIEFEPFKCFHRNHGYKALLWEQKEFANILKRMLTEVIPETAQTLVFIKNEKQVKFLKKEIPEATVAMAKVLTTKERDKLLEDMQAGTITRCLASDIYSQGVTFPDIACIINACGGGGNISAIQKPGRLLQNRPGKEKGVIIDFLYTCTQQPRFMRHQQWGFVHYDSHARLKSYINKGYEVEVIESLTDEHIAEIQHYVSWTSNT